MLSGTLPQAVPGYLLFLGGKGRCGGGGRGSVEGCAQCEGRGSEGERKGGDWLKKIIPVLVQFYYSCHIYY